MRRRLLALIGLALALGLVTLAYRGPGRAFVRGHLGDVAATILVYAVLRLATRVPARWCAVTTMSIAIAIELDQLVWTGVGRIGELVIGSRFDPLDLLAYVAGTLFAVAFDHARGGPKPAAGRLSPPGASAVRGRAGSGR